MRIAHLADIHVQDRRRLEYAAVFARLYESLRHEAPDLIVVAGDVFDNKMRASPHNLVDVAALLTSLVAIAPVVLIAGNHDTNCLAPGSLDLLTPLVADRRALQPPRLTYWRQSGVYAAHGCAWTVIATDGARPTEEAEQLAITAAGLEAAPHICLFHEEVNGALMPNGTQMRDFKLATASFGQYDLALGGHIHLRQRFAPRAAYCGSLIQQNIGESHLGHGYLLWEFETGAGHEPYRTSQPRMRGVDIPNDNGFVRVEVDAAGRDVTPHPLPKSPLYWELIHDEDAPAALVAELSSEYEAMYEMLPRAVRPRPRKGPPAEGGGGAPTDEGKERAELVSAQTASRTLASHEEIIRELLAGDENVEAVLSLHRARWSEPAAQVTGGKFRILRFEFDNMYAFGPANVVDFTALEGCVSGVIAPNHTGKSSLIEALIFALYEEHPRAPSKKDVIHRGAGSCHLTLDFELDGKPGRIIKGMFGGKNDKAGSQYRFEYAGEDRTQGGTVETLAAIESVLGGAINALASSFQLQGGEAGGFIGATPAGRKKLIASVMGLGSFEALERATTKEYTECGGEVKVLASQFRGDTKESLAELLLTAEGDADDAAALARRLDREATEAQCASTDAQRALGTEQGLNIGHQAAAAAAAENADRLRAVPETLVADEAVTSLGARIGVLTPAELEIPPSAQRIPPEVAPDIPTLEDVARASRATHDAAQDLADATARESAARIEAAKASRPAEELSLARAALAAAQAGLAAEQSAPELSDPEPKPPTAPRTGIGHDPTAFESGVEGSRRGPRPSPAEVAAAQSQLRRLGVITQDQRALAARWDQSEETRLETIVREHRPRGPTCPPTAPQGHRPTTVPYPALGERLGERPSTSALSAAATEYDAGRTYDEATAERWNPAEYKNLATAMDSLKTTPAPNVAQESLEAANLAQTAAAQKHRIALDALAALGDEAREAERAASPSANAGGDIASTAAALRSAQEWLAATTHAAAIKARLRPCEGCVGCAHAQRMLDSEKGASASAAVAAAQVAHHAALASAYRRAAQTERSAKDELVSASAAVAAATAASRQSAARDVAQKRLDDMGVTKLHYETRESRRAAIAVLETENYWIAHEVQEWTLYDSRKACVEAETEREVLATQRASEADSALEVQSQAASQRRLINAETAAVAVLEAANHWAAIDHYAWQQYDVKRELWDRELAAATQHRAWRLETATNEHASAQEAYREALAAADHATAAQEAHHTATNQMKMAQERATTAGAEEATIIKARRAAIGAYAWWQAAALESAAAQKVHAAAAQAATVAQESAARVVAAEKVAYAMAEAATSARTAARSAAQKQHANQREVARLQQELAQESARAVRYEAALAQQAALKAYRAVLRPAGGIGDRLLDRGRAALNRQVNLALRELGARCEAEINEDYSVSIRTSEGDWLPASLGSGYQKFVLSLAARLAVWRLSAAPRPDAFIVDEGFGACDEDYLESMVVALESLAAAPGGPRLVFVVSHVDALKVRLERALEIESLPMGSRVANALRRQAPASLAQLINAAAAEPAPAAPAPTVMRPLLPDAEKVGNVYCEVCHQSLRASWANKHLASAKHITAEAKAAAKPR
jgi:DNA repair exonuclease SbcCD nuclease subunit